MSLNNDYDPQTLKKLQRVELMMLRDFTSICKENDIHYFMHFGTAIGVIRHKGFIPWDDDIDICILREDYNKFAEIVSKGKWAEKYEMISGANSDVYLVPESHWQLRGTKFVDKPSLDYKGINLGIFLDFFIYDNVSDDPKLAKKQMRDCFFWRMCMIMRTMTHPVINFTGIKYALIKSVIVVGHYMMALFHISPRWLYNKYTKASTRYNNIKTKYKMSFRAFELESTKLSNDEIFPLKEFSFDGVPVTLPNSIDKSLRKVYGDYMVIPPKEKRHNHRPEILDFGPYDNI